MAAQAEVVCVWRRRGGVGAGRFTHGTHITVVPGGLVEGGGHSSRSRIQTTLALAHGPVPNDSLLTFTRVLIAPLLEHPHWSIRS